MEISGALRPIYGSLGVRRLKIFSDEETRRCKQLLDDVKETRGYWKLKEEALDRTLCRTPFERGYGPVIIQTVQ